MENLKELEALTNAYFEIHHGTTEVDMSINDISRQKIKSFWKEKGSAFLGKFNLQGTPKFGSYKLTEFSGQKIFNFDFDFCTDSQDEKLATLVMENKKNCNISNVEAIYERVLKLKGVILHWA